jgi:hypothetical protein
LSKVFVSLPQQQALDITIRSRCRPPYTSTFLKPPSSLIQHPSWHIRDLARDRRATYINTTFDFEQSPLFSTLISYESRPSKGMVVGRTNLDEEDLAQDD